MNEVKFIKSNNLGDFYIIGSTLDAKPIGFFGIKNNEVVGLYLDEEYRNLGHGTEIVKLITKEFPNVVFVTHVNNTKMQYVLEKVGYTKFLKYEMKR